MSNDSFPETDEIFLKNLSNKIENNINLDWTNEKRLIQIKNQYDKYQKDNPNNPIEYAYYYKVVLLALKDKTKAKKTLNDIFDNPHHTLNFEDLFPKILLDEFDVDTVLNPIPPYRITQGLGFEDNSPGLSFCCCLINDNPSENKDNPKPANLEMQRV